MPHPRFPRSSRSTRRICRTHWPPRAEAVVVLLNLSRDQLDRHSETRMLAQLWRKTLAQYPNATVVANADDPLVVWAARDAPGVVWADGGADWFGDAATCPECGRLLERDATTARVHWWCECGLRRPTADVARNADDIVVDRGSYALRLALPGRANKGNATMAVGAAGAFGVEPRDALRRDRGRARGFGPLRPSSPRRPRYVGVTRQEPGGLG